MDLVQMAAFGDHEVLWDGKVILILRGQVPTSERDLMDRWAWRSRGKVRRFLRMLVKAGRIEWETSRSRIGKKTDQKTDHGLTLITICDYMRYQSSGTRDDTSTDTSNGTTVGPRSDQTEKGKEGKETTTSYPPEVLEVFSYWQDQRAKAVGKTSGPPMKPTRLRMSKIQRRLSEGYTGGELKEAVDGCLSNPRNLQGGHTDIELICRDQAHVEQYLAWYRNGPPKSRDERSGSPSHPYQRLP